MSDIEKPAGSDAQISATAMRAFMTDAFVACGLSEHDAAITAGAMLEADLTGSDAHGIFRLASYVRALQGGRIKPKANIKVVERSPATALVDGDNGMGHLVMTFATNTAVELARATGVAWVGAKHSNHAGAAGIYPEIALRAGMVGIYAAASSANHMAATGGAEAMLGTNPIAVAIPTGDEAPIVLDIATSVASFGKIRTYALEGRPLPEGWVIDRSTGQPITDASQANKGILVPIGDYKGAGLALIIGLLAATLNGAAFGHDVRDFNSDNAGISNTGQFVMALDVARFMPLERFRAEVDRHIGDLHASPKLPGFDTIRLPGEGRVQRRAERERNGVPLPRALIDQLDEVAQSLDIAPLAARPA